MSSCHSDVVCMTTAWVCRLYSASTFKVVSVRRDFVAVVNYWSVSDVCGPRQCDPARTGEIVSSLAGARTNLRQWRKLDQCWMLLDSASLCWLMTLACIGWMRHQHHHRRHPHPHPHHLQQQSRRSAANVLAINSVSGSQAERRNEQNRNCAVSSLVMYRFRSGIDFPRDRMHTSAHHWTESFEDQTTFVAWLDKCSA